LESSSRCSTQSSLTRLEHITRAIDIGYIELEKKQ
jgi:hypothetical protein